MTTDSASDVNESAGLPTQAPLKSATQPYYAAFSYTAPRDCNECGERPCREHLDAEDVDAVVAFLIGGWMNWPAERCGHECDCDTVAIHEAAWQESMREFLRNPGPPPAHFSAADIARAQTSMRKAVGQ